MEREIPSVMFFRVQDVSLERVYAHAPVEHVQYAETGSGQVYPVEGDVAKG